MFFLQLKDTKFNTSINKDNLLTITSRGNEVCVIENIELVYSRIKVKNGKIKLIANLRSPIFAVFIEYPPTLFKELLMPYFSLIEANLSFLSNFIL